MFSFHPAHAGGQPQFKGELEEMFVEARKNVAAVKRKTGYIIFVCRTLYTMACPIVLLHLLLQPSS